MRDGRYLEGKRDLGYNSGELCKLLKDCFKLENKHLIKPSHVHQLSVIHHQRKLVNGPCNRGKLAFAVLRKKTEYSIRTDGPMNFSTLETAAAGSRTRAATAAEVCKFEALGGEAALKKNQRQRKSEEEEEEVRKKRRSERVSERAR